MSQRIEETMDTPKWVLENTHISRLLNTFITKIDKGQQRLSIKVSQKTVPELFNFDSQDLSYLWSLVEDLEKEFEIIQIKTKRKNTSQEIYEGAMLYFNVDREGLVRQWLGRENTVSYEEAWASACRDVESTFGGDFEFLVATRIKHKSKSAFDIVEGFAKADKELEKAASIPLRTLSARCFWGDSKFLDGRIDLLQTLFPLYRSRIKNRELLINVSIPNDFQKILFIENQDTFLKLSDAQLKEGFLSSFAIVYSSGFKGSAARIRSLDNVVFSFVGKTTSQAMISKFEKWWSEGDDGLSSFFWGDMDYSGMGILVSLRNVFDGIAAWQPGYLALIMILENGCGHLPDDTDKTEQRDPEFTDCEFADSKLLPLLRARQRFVDQEAALLSEIRLKMDELT